MTHFSKNFSKSVAGYLAGCSTDTCVTREALAAAIKPFFGADVDAEVLERWVGDSVKLGLFNSSNVKYDLKRGVKGGITAQRVEKKRSKPITVQA